MADGGSSGERRVVVRHEDPADALRWWVGEVIITRVPEGVIELSPRWLLPDLSRELLASCGDWVAPYFTTDGRMLLSMHSFVVESGDNVVVVDTCVGAHTPRPLPGDDGFGARLTQALPDGLESVDVVVCTHLHFDHVGWNTRRVGDEWVPTFPNACYLVTEAELEAARADGSEIMEPSVTPLVERGLLDAVTPDHRIDDRVRLVDSAGHTPGHVCVAIESAGERALITGDSFHTPVQFAHPELAATYADSDSPAAAATRERLIGELADTTTVVLGTHFAPPTAGHVRRGAEGVWFEGATGPVS
ncbi:MAG: MBL fold metallo-hydrolase [Ilumatobacteraceae bacterium]